MTELKKANSPEIGKLNRAIGEVEKANLSESENNQVETGVVKNEFNVNVSESSSVNTQKNTGINKGSEVLLKKDQNVNQESRLDTEGLKNLLTNLLNQNNNTGKDGKEMDYSEMTRHVTGV
jgi:hypothetical protein